MARFFGEIGFGFEVTIDGITDVEIVENQYFGDVINEGVKATYGDEINSQLTIANSFSIVADAYANEHFFAMRYIRWMGVRWTITKVEVQHPRLIIRVGEVYNGPEPTPSGAPGNS